MQVTGTIASVQPTQNGGYQSQNGYIYTYDMVVNGPNGQVNGEIGSKSNPYPKQVGQEITVEASEGQYGPRLKNINLQHQGGGQQGQQQRSQPAQSKTKEPDWDAIAEGKTRCAVVCAAIQSGQIPCVTHEDAVMHTKFILTGQVPNGQQSFPQDDIPY